MKKRKYVESLETCVFMGECIDYLQHGKNILILTKLLTSFTQVLSNKKSLGFEGFPRRSTWIGRVLSRVFPSCSWVFRIPGIKLSGTSNAKRAYQLWCQAFSWIDSDTAKEICDCAIENGRPNEWRGHQAWIMLKDQNRYIPIFSEILWWFLVIVMFILGQNPFKKLTNDEIKEIK